MANFIEELGGLQNKIYDKVTPEWATPNWGEDYQRHLFNVSTGGDLFTGYLKDYGGFKADGMSDDDALKNTGQNLGVSAAILAAIFGGSYLAGAGEVAGEGAGTVNTGALTSGLDLGGMGFGGGSGATYGTGTSLTSGLDLGGMGFGGASAYGEGAGPLTSGLDFGASGYGAYTPEGEGVNWLDQLENLQQSGSKDQQENGYGSIMDNMLKLSPWTVAKRDPARMAQLLALLRGRGQGGIMGF